ncbi:hypothetical protein [Pelomonas cellulosilytica]|uniref:Uncharacterized protein n=1 Tax=Pelomonas cellulosilytica TaxID=2906762 RepID=A0ABS8XZG2_9BURK|nr:hypothetical protein [Pelomonas sp. P8]MCE4556660.1 hypothetical protein [Pelomonas sp. P8]
MSGLTQYCAFKGDPAHKAEMVGRVRARWTEGRAFPLAYLKWRTDGGMVSLSGTLAETQVPHEFVERTGLPLELATLCEGVVYAGVDFSEDKSKPAGLAISGSDATMAFAMKWLDAIAVGADLGDVVPRFMLGFLSGVLARDFVMAPHVRPAVRACGERILALWEREMRDEPVAPKEWRTLRADAMRAAEDDSDPWSYAAGELVESLAWPVRGLAPEFVAIFQLFMKEVRQFLVAPFLTSEDRDILMKSLVGLRELVRAQRDPELSQLPTETLLDRDPQTKQAVTAFMHADVQARFNATRPQAQSQSDSLLHRHMQSLQRLIETAGPTPSSAA